MSFVKVYIHFVWSTKNRVPLPDNVQMIKNWVSPFHEINSNELEMRGSHCIKSIQMIWNGLQPIY